MDKDEFRHIDRYFSDFIHRVVPDCSPRLLEVMSTLSHTLSQQHSCLDLSNLADKQQIITELHELELTAENSPVALHGDKLYLRRYFQYEKIIVRLLESRNQPLDIYNSQQLSKCLKQQFSSDNNIDWQQIAALQALTRKLTIITGGPGTGKTTIVARIILLLNELAPAPLQIRLAAPTGKAAMRLGQSLAAASNVMERPVVQTLHRLLGMRRDERTYRYHADNPITADVLIVDEASMIDLPMMHRILTAIPKDCRLILTGDPDQLPSVEVGNVLADICSRKVGYSKAFHDLVRDIAGVSLPVDSSGDPLSDVICRLQVSYRFSPDKGIGGLSHHVIQRNPDMPENDTGIEILDPAQLKTSGGNNLLMAEYRDYFSLLHQRKEDPSTLVRAFDQTRILAPMREGPLGIEDLNNRIETTLEKRGLKNPFSDIYHGKPILILHNDYNLDLYNGDVGICIGDGDHPMVAFISDDGEIRMMLASRLPPHETCFAMTVHKSQGSEYDAVTLIMPTSLTAGSEQLMNRELVYTAITRAKSKVKLYCTQDIWKLCMTNSQPRVSGLADFFSEQADTAAGDIS